MMTDNTDCGMPQFGTWADAEELRKWSFARRTPQQRLDWLVQALSIAYSSGALKSVAPAVAAPARSGSPLSKKI
jgi:hypothetical protein